MPKVTSYTRSRIESLYNQGTHPAKIFKELSKEGLKVSFASVTRIIKKIQDTGSTKNLHRSGRPTKLSVDAKSFIEHQEGMRNVTLEECTFLVNNCTKKCIPHFGGIHVLTTDNIH